MISNDKRANKLTKTLLITYLIMLLWILLFKFGVRFSYMENREVNLVPFKSDSNVDKAETILNVVIFIPLGIYAGVLFTKWSFAKKVFYFFLTSLSFEVLQLIFKIGAFDSTDIITNTFGGVLGLLIFIAIGKIFNNNFKAQKFINIIATIATVMMITLLLLLKMNMLPIKYQ